MLAPQPFDVILPVLDEIGALPSVLDGLPSECTAIVVDNGSTDGSGDLARALGARVVDESRRGFGSACWAGLVAATADVVAFMDCDGSFRGDDLVSVARPVLEGHADLVLGARTGTDGRPLHARLANRALAFEIRRRTGVRLADLGPMRAARRRDLLDLGIVDRRSGWPLEMVLRASASGWRIEEQPVHHGRRVGRSKVTGTVGGTLRAVRDMAGVLR